MRVLSLFAGVGGMEIGLERAGMTTAAQVELDPYCLAVLAKHWPDALRHNDVTTFPDWWGETPRPGIGLVCAGFPCQPFSLAGKQLGVNDERWMWPATLAAICAVRPTYVLLENVSALVRDRLAFGRILGDLHGVGFDAEWATLRASDFGAPTPRERVYLLAYPAGVYRGSWHRVDTCRDGQSPISVRGLCGLDVVARWRAASAWLATEPRVDRLVDGIPDQSHRLRVAGNAVVPAVAEAIGRLAMADHAWRNRAVA